MSNKGIEWHIGWHIVIPRDSKMTQVNVSAAKANDLISIPGIEIVGGD